MKGYLLLSVLMVLMVLMLGCQAREPDNVSQKEQSVKEMTTLEFDRALDETITFKADGEVIESDQVSTGNPVEFTLTIYHENGWVERVDATIEHNSPTKWSATHSAEGGFGPEPNSFTIDATVDENSPSNEPFTVTFSSPYSFQFSR